MNYEKKYNDLLNNVKGFHARFGDLSNIKTEMEECIPELAESEDERIRKAIKMYVEDMPDTFGFAHGIAKKDMLAYLERQKEQKIARWKSLGECIDIPNGHYVVGWFRRGDFRLGIMCNGLFIGTDGNRAEQPKEVFYIPNADEEFVYAEQKSAEWGEEDERKINRIYEILGHAADDKGFLTSKRIIGDKEAIELQDFLKSLRPSWKPSEEQINSLEYFIKLWGNSDGQMEYIKVFNDVKLLYQQLKKL